MTDIRERLFAELDANLNVVEIKHDPDRNVPQSPDLTLVADRGSGDLEVESENDQTGDVSGKIAALNDRFRQDPYAKDSDIKGEWIMGDDVSALPAPTKAAITRRIAEADNFQDIPLRDRGEFVYESKGRDLPVIWMIKVFADETKAVEATEPENPKASYRVMLVTLSEE